MSDEPDPIEYGDKDDDDSVDESDERTGEPQKDTD